MLTELLIQLTEGGLYNLKDMQAHLLKHNPEANLTVYADMHLSCYRDNSYLVGLWCGENQLDKINFIDQVTYLNFNLPANTKKLVELQQHHFIASLALLNNPYPILVLFWLDELDYFVTDDHNLQQLLAALKPSCQIITMDSIAEINSLDPNSRTFASYVNPIQQAGCFEISECKHGLFCYNRHDFYVGNSLRRYGEYSELEVKLFQEHLKPGDSVIEVGANIGAHTIPLAKLVGPNGHVHAFEPQKLAFDLLTTNTMLNGLTQIHTEYKAIGDENKMLQLSSLDPHESHNFGHYKLSNHSEGKLVVAQITLDSSGIDQCDFLKIDVEGMELNVLKGGMELIKKCRPIIYMEADDSETSQQTIDLLKSLNYNCQEHKPALFNVDNYRDNSETIFGETISFNFLCLPE